VVTRSFNTRVAILNSRGDHLRSIPAVAARAMVDAGHLIPKAGSGRIREAEISQPASSHAVRTGEPSLVTALGVRFVRRVRLDESATTIYEHHPRALYEED
jgi:hypothetical protein